MNCRFTGSENVCTRLMKCLIVSVALVVTACSGVNARKHEFLERAQTYYVQKNYDKARVELRNALQMDPKFAEAHLLAGQVAEKRNDIREAAGHYLAALDANSKFQPARAALARIYMLSGLSSKARDLVADGLKQEPKNAALLTVRGALEAQSGHLVAGLEDAEAAYKLTPNDEYTISLLASLYKQSARIDKAVEVVESGMKTSPDNVDLHVVLADLKNARHDDAGVEEQLKQIIKLEPDNISHRARLVQFYLYHKHADAAEAVWRQAIADMPEKVEPKLALIDLLWAQHSEDAAMAEMQRMTAQEPDNAELQLAMGSYLQRQGRVDRAEQIYLEVMKQKGTDAKGLQARDQLAALYLRRNDAKLNDEQRAKSLIAEVLKENPRDNDALILRANMALQHGDAATAITDLRSVLRDQPNSTPLMRALAKAHLENNEPSLAEETLRNAVQINPGDVEARKQLAQLLLQRGKADQAKPILEQLAASEAKLSLDVAEGLFRTQMQTRDLDGAQTTVEKVQQQYPDKAVGWYYAALLAEAHQDKELARKDYERALQLQPDIAEPLVALVRLDIEEKHSKQAMERVNKIIAAQPNNSIAYNLRGELQAADKQWPSASATFRHVTELAPQWATGYRGLAMAQLQQKQVNDAITTYQTGINKAGDPALVVSLALLQENSGKPDDAIKTYEAWLQRDPKSLPVANNLSMLLLNYHGDDKASLERVAKLTDLLTASSDPATLDTRGWYKYKRGDYQAAVNLLQQAASSPQISATIRYHLGMAQLRTGNTAAARDNLQAALAGGQMFFGAEEAKNTLSTLKQSG